MKDVMKPIIFVLVLLLAIGFGWYYYIGNTTFSEEILTFYEKFEEGGWKITDIKDKEMIKRYRDFYDGLEFLEVERERPEETNFRLEIVDTNNDRGSYLLLIWMIEDEIIAAGSIREYNRYALLTEEQLKELLEIFR